jgi:hypothetical protein
MNKLRRVKKQEGNNMPRVKPLGRADPREAQVRQKIGGILMALNGNSTRLAELTGIKYGTLMKRIGKGGDIGSMRLSELWAIEDLEGRIL